LIREDVIFTGGSRFDRLPQLCKFLSSDRGVLSDTLPAFGNLPIATFFTLFLQDFVLIFVDPARLLR
jgi:hypothetical protein